MEAAVKSALSPRLHKILSEEVYRHTGVVINESKQDLLVARLGRRVRALGLPGFKEYVDLLVAGKLEKEEFSVFIDQVTTHKTSFFRTVSVWNYLREHILHQAGESGRPLRIWSAACSNGDEVYSVALECARQRSVTPSLAWRILATDVSAKRVALASEGRYEAEAIEKIAEKREDLPWDRVFQPVGNGEVQVSRSIRSQIEFRPHNLFEPISRSFDVIFLRNVVMYFSDEDKARVFRHAEKALNQGGYLITGESESPASQTDLFEYRQPCIYQKPS